MLTVAKELNDVHAQNSVEDCHKSCRQAHRGLFYDPAHVDKVRALTIAPTFGEGTGDARVISISTALLCGSKDGLAIGTALQNAFLQTLIAFHNKLYKQSNDTRTHNKTPTVLLP